MKFLTTRLSNDETLFIPILSISSKHWVKNNVSFIYAFELTTQIEYIIGINHNDTCQGSLPTTTSKDYIYNKSYLNRKKKEKKK